MNRLENQQAAEQIDRIYMDLEELLMQNIMRHCRDYGQPIATDEWLLKKLAEIGKLNKENIKIIAQVAGLSRTAVERMLNEAAEETLDQVEPALAYLTRQGLVGEPVELPKSKAVQKTVRTLQNQAKDTTNLCNTTMLYKARDAYKKLITNISFEASEISQKQDFLDSLNKHATATVIGAESRQQAVRKCIKEFNDKGIPAFVDKKGREWTPEAYVNMAMRNTAKNVADEVQSARCLDYGVNLIEISSHSGARPKCAKDQGKIYDLNNGSGYVEDVTGKKVRYYPWNSTSYGEPDGILGINCTHHKFPFWPGVSLQTYFPVEDQEASDRLYKQTQVQRSLERDIRKQKRLCMLYDEAGEKDAFEDASVALKQKEAQLKNYIDKTPQLHRRKDREQVVGFDRDISAKAVAANKKYSKLRDIEKSQFVGILEESTDKWSKGAKEELMKDEYSLASRQKEVAVVYSPNGKFMFQKRGGEAKVSFNKKEIKQMKNCVVTHNHPSGSSFSSSDICLLWGSEAAEIRASTETGVYFIRQPKIWPKSINTAEKIKASRKRIEAEVREEYISLYSQSGMLEHDIFCMASDETNRRFCEKYGIDYGKEEFNE